MKQWIDKLRQERTLRPEEFRQLLTGCDADSLRIINEQAREVSLRHFGNRIYIRGLIEISNCCRNNCYYCGIRKGNPHVARYRLSPESILDCCKQGYALGFRTFVLQGGEDPALTDDRIETIVAAIRRHYPDCAITLSLGEKSREAYERFFHAGANRYLLRHETYDATHYSQLHPAGMSGKQRLQCLQNLKETGYQTGTGIMVGSPGQTVEHLIQDILFIDKLVSVVDTGRNDHVTYTTRKTNDRALAESLTYCRLFISWFSGDLARSTEGNRLLDSLKTDFRRFSILSGDYGESRRAASEGYKVTLPYRLLEFTRTGRLAWGAVKIAMKIKWSLSDRLKR